MHIGAMDLNLARVLHALLDERSVSRAARRLGLSQSATSHALARLRDVLGDPLFVRSPTGLAPTPRAAGMAGPLAAALAGIEQAFFAPPAFDPATARRTFNIGASDYAEHVLMPPLLTRLARDAPEMEVWARPVPPDPAEALAQGQLDLVLGPLGTYSGGEALKFVELWEDRFVCAARRGHPLVRAGLSLDHFVAARHVFIAPRGRPGGAVDDALARLGRRRRIAFTTPNFLVAPLVVARTDLIITLASRVATAFARVLPLELFAPPIDLPGFRVAMFWHERHEADPAHRFLRDEMARIARELPAIAPVAAAPPARRRRSAPARGRTGGARGR